MDTKLNRNKKIIQTSMIGILANVFLSIFKIIGEMNSISLKKPKDLKNFGTSGIYYKDFFIN